MDPSTLWLLEQAGVILALLGLAAYGLQRQAGLARRREMEHAERMKAIECGYPLPEDDSARARALGRVGVFSTAGGMAAAAWATQLIFSQPASDAPRWLIAVVWGTA